MVGWVGGWRGSNDFLIHSNLSIQKHKNPVVFHVCMLRWISLSIHPSIPNIHPKYPSMDSFHLLVCQEEPPPPIFAAISFKIPVCLFEMHGMQVEVEDAPRHMMESIYLVTSDNFTASLLDLVDLLEEVPETGLCNRLVYGKDTHSEQFGSQFLLRGLFTANDLKLVIFSGHELRWREREREVDGDRDGDADGWKK